MDAVPMGGDDKNAFSKYMRNPKLASLILLVKALSVMEDEGLPDMAGNALTCFLPDPYPGLVADPELSLNYGLRPLFVRQWKFNTPNIENLWNTQGFQGIACFFGGHMQKHRPRNILAGALNSEFQGSRRGFPLQ